MTRELGDWENNISDGLNAGRLGDRKLREDGRKTGGLDTE